MKEQAPWKGRVLLDLVKWLRVLARGTQRACAHLGFLKSGIPAFACDRGHEVTDLQDHCSILAQDSDPGRPSRKRPLPDRLTTRASITSTDGRWKRASAPEMLCAGRRIDQYRSIGPRG